MSWCITPRQLFDDDVDAETTKEVLDRSTIKPALTLVGMSVPKNFYGALSTGRIVDGFLIDLSQLNHICQEL